MATHYLALKPFEAPADPMVRRDGKLFTPFAVCPVFETEEEAYEVCGLDVIVIPLEATPIPE